VISCLRNVILRHRIMILRQGKGRIFHGKELFCY
jgi:hypothetical protein